MTHVPAKLDYAQATPWLRRRGMRRVVFCGLMLGELLASVKGVGVAWNHGWMLHWQGQCLGYVAPADWSVFFGGAEETAPCWREFYARFSPPGRRDAGTAFLHEMKRRDGGRRLV